MQIVSLTEQVQINSPEIQERIKKDLSHLRKGKAIRFATNTTSIFFSYILYFEPTRNPANKKF